MISYNFIFDLFLFKLKPFHSAIDNKFMGVDKLKAKQNPCIIYNKVTLYAAIKSKIIMPLIIICVYLLLYVSTGQRTRSAR